MPADDMDESYTQLSSNISLSKGDEDTTCHSPQFMPSNSQTLTLSPADVRPFPKAEPRKLVINKKGRKKAKTRILTDTPEKEEIERQSNRKTQKDFVKAKPQKKRKFLADESRDEDEFLSVHDTVNIDINLLENIKEIYWEAE